MATSANIKPETENRPGKITVHHGEGKIGSANFPGHTTWSCANTDKRGVIRPWAQKPEEGAGDECDASADP